MSRFNPKKHGQTRKSAMQSPLIFRILLCGAILLCAMAVCMGYRWPDPAPTAPSTPLPGPLFLSVGVAPVFHSDENPYEEQSADFVSRVEPNRRADRHLERLRYEDDRDRLWDSNGELHINPRVIWIVIYVALVLLKIIAGYCTCTAIDRRYHLLAASERARQRRYAREVRRELRRDERRRARDLRYQKKQSP